MKSLGPGFRFHPTNVELIMYYLKRKVMGRKFHRDGIRVLNVYNFAPWDLPGKARWKRDLKWYFFCPRERKYSTGERTKRSTKHGFWKTTGIDRKVHYNGEIVGVIKSLIFHTQNPTQRTNWVMHEYKLQDEYLKQLGLEEDVYVLCVIFEKKGRGPRNGAQYGGPYIDKDWDDDNDSVTDDDEADNCGEDTNVVGALTQVHTDKGKNTVLNDFERAVGYCVGSSSRTLPSEIDQSVNHGFPPTPVPGTLFMDSRLPLSDECGIFVHEIPSASHENEQAQDIGVDQDITCEPSIPANEKKIFDDLEAICELFDFSDSGIGALGCDVLANQKIQFGDYLQLADLEFADRVDVSGPLEGSHDHDHIGPGQPSPSFGPMIPEGVPVSTLVGQQNWSVGISDGMLSWNEHRQEPAERERPINDPRTGLSRFRSSNFPDSVSSELHIPYLDQCPPVFEENVSHMNQHGQTADGSIGFHGQEASMNEQMDHHFDSVGTAAPFGTMQPPQSMPRGSPHYPS